MRNSVAGTASAVMAYSPGLGRTASACVPPVILQPMAVYWNVGTHHGCSAGFPSDNRPRIQGEPEQAPAPRADACATVPPREDRGHDIVVQTGTFPRRFFPVPV